MFASGTSCKRHAEFPGEHRIPTALRNDEHIGRKSIELRALAIDPLATAPGDEAEGHPAEFGSPHPGPLNPRGPSTRSLRLRSRSSASRRSPTLRYRRLFTSGSWHQEVNRVRLQGGQVDELRRQPHRSDAKRRQTS